MIPHQQPRLVVLNGASSSGKTITAQALGHLWGSACVQTGFDDILERVQPFGPETSGTLLRSIRILWFQYTDGRLRLFRRLHREITALIAAGNDVIVDTALMDPRALYDAATNFAPLGGLFVGMKPPLEVSEAWEATRSARAPGQARKHYDLIHAHGIYDLVLDPSQLTPQVCAQTIVERLAGPAPTAFRRLLEGQGRQ